METLLDIYARHIVDGFPDKGSVHSYVEVYEEILAPYRTTAKNVLEIGILNGASLKMWESFFDGEVYGIDCTDQPHDGMADLRPMIASGKHNIVIMDANDPAQVQQHFGEIKFDIIIEDSSHQLEHQLKQFENFFPLLNPKGIYIIEDCADIDRDRAKYEALHTNVEILDRRKLKNRFDDCLIIIRK